MKTLPNTLEFIKENNRDASDELIKSIVDPTTAQSDHFKIS